jgi:hypothetical protein
MNKILKIVITFVVIYSAALSFTFAYVISDENKIPNQTHSFYINSIPNTVSHKKIANEINNIAQETHINIFLLDESISDQYIYYSFIGNPEDYNPSKMNNFASFQPSKHITLKSYKDLGETKLLQEYLIQNGKITPSQLSAAFSKTDIKINPENIQKTSLLYDIRDSESFTSVFFLQSFGQTNSVVIILLLFSIVYSLLKGSKSVITKRVVGQSQSRICFDELKKILIFQLLSAIVVFSLSSLAIFFYNGLAQYSLFALPLVIIYLISLVITAFCVFFSFVFYKFKITPSVIKGKLPTRPITCISIVMQVISLAIFFFGLGQVVPIISQTSNETNALMNIKSLHSIYVNYENKEEDPNSSSYQPLLDSAGATVIREADKRGILLLESSCNEENFFSDTNLIDATTSTNSILANVAFARNSKLKGDSGEQINFSHMGNSIYLLIPKIYKEKTNQLIKNVDASFFYRHQVKANGDEAPANSYQKYDIKPIYISNDQKVLGLTENDFGENKATITNAVIAVFPKLDLVDDITLGENFATGGDALFTDVNKAKTITKNLGLSKDVTVTFTNEMSTVNHILQQQIVALVEDVAVILMLLFTALFTTLILSFAYCNKNKQRLFAEYTNGWSFWSSNCIYILLSLIVPVVTFLILGSKELIPLMISYGIIIAIIATNVISLRVNQSKFTAITIKQN